MDWLMHNWVADMYGPHFLALYAMVILATFAACRLALWSSDWTARAPEARVPTNPDPYEIAYLRGGVNELIRSIIFKLIQQNFLRVDQTGKEPLIARTSTVPPRHRLSPVEERAYDWFVTPRAAAGIFSSGGLSGVIEPFCTTYEEKLRRDNLLMPADVRQAAIGIWLAGTLLIAGLGGYKLLVALSKGRTNVGFLIIMCIVALLILIRVCRAPRISRRGRLYLERLQLAFSGLKAQPLNLMTNAATASSAAAVDTTPLLLVGLFGVGALSGTAYDYYQQTFRRASMTGGTCGGSTTGCGSGSSGGDSGGGGGCGGGGCGGGGCGGCGG